MIPETTPTLPPLPGRIRLLHAVLMVFALALIGQAARVQLFQNDQWVQLARRHQVKEVAEPAPRGDIEDVTGVPVAYSRELVRLSVAKKQRRDLKALGAAMRAAGIPEREVRRAIGPGTNDSELRGVYLPAKVAPVIRHYGCRRPGCGSWWGWWDVMGEAGPGWKRCSTRSCRARRIARASWSGRAGTSSRRPRCSMRRFAAVTRCGSP